MYLTGFTLFLSLVLTRSFYIILDLIHTQEQYAILKKETAGKSRASGAGDQKTIEELKAKLAASEAKGRDFGENFLCSFVSPLPFPRFTVPPFP